MQTEPYQTYTWIEELQSHDPKAAFSFGQDLEKLLILVGWRGKGILRTFVMFSGGDFEFEEMRLALAYSSFGDFPSLLGKVCGGQEWIISTFSLLKKWFELLRNSSNDFRKPNKIWGSNKSITDRMGCGNNLEGLSYWHFRFL